MEQQSSLMNGCIGVKPGFTALFWLTHCTSGPFQAQSCLKIKLMQWKHGGHEHLLLYLDEILEWTGRTGAGYRRGQDISTSYMSNIT